MNEELEPGDGAPIGSEWEIDVIDRTDGSAASEKRLAEVAGYVLRDEGVEHAEISVAVVDDLEMARLHADFLQIDGPTDVLTFPLEGDSLEAWAGPVDARRGSGRRICGEVVIGGDCKTDDRRNKPPKGAVLKEPQYGPNSGAPQIYVVASLT